MFVRDCVTFALISNLAFGQWAQIFFSLIRCVFCFMTDAKGNMECFMYVNKSHGRETGTQYHIKIIIIVLHFCIRSLEQSYALNQSESSGFEWKQCISGDWKWFGFEGKTKEFATDCFFLLLLSLREKTLFLLSFFFFSLFMSFRIEFLDWNEKHMSTDK